MKFQSGIATALVATFPLSSPVPVEAAPIFVPRAQSAQSDVIQVRDRWYRGYRGYRHHHRHNDFWAPAGAFVAGALLGSVIANNNGYYGGYYRSGVYGDPYYGGPYYGDPYYRAPYADSYYADPYFRAPYYGNRYYGNRYYGDRVHSNRSYRPCSPREADSGNCY